MEVGPTGYAYLFVLLLSIGAAVYSQANMMFLAAGLLLGGLAVSVVWVWAGLRGLELERAAPTHGVAGEELVLHYRLAKRSRVPAFSLVLTETWGRGAKGYRTSGPLSHKPRRLLERPTGWVMHLPGRRVCQAQASCWPARRGVLGLQRVELHTDFPFGLLRRTLVFEDADEVLVLPRIRRMTRQAMTGIARLDAGGFNHLDKEGGTEEFYALRDYRKGDSLKVIDWKHSARTGKLLSRELTQPVPPTITILLDLGMFARASLDAPPRELGEDQLRQVDRAVALTASLICDAFIAGYRVGLTVSGAEGDPLKPHHSQPHRTLALERLARLVPGTAPAIERHTGEAPSVIVRPGRGGGRTIRAGRRAFELYGDDLDKLTLYAKPEHVLRMHTAGPREPSPTPPQTPTPTATNPAAGPTRKARA